MDGDNETADRGKILFEATQELIAAEYNKLKEFNSNFL